MKIPESELTELINNTLNRHANVTQHEFALVRQLDVALTDADLDTERDLVRVMNDHAARRARIASLLNELGARIGRLPVPGTVCDVDDFPMITKKGQAQ